MQAAKNPATANWARQLRGLREREGLTRDALAALAGVAPATVKAYESGSRQPSREMLSALLDALKLDVHARHEILVGAGFAPDNRHVERIAGEWFTLEEAAEEMAASPIPCNLNNKFIEVVAANSLIQQVWETDFHRENAGPYERSMVSMMTHEPTSSRLLNWDEAFAFAIGILKGHYGEDAGALAAESPYFAGMIGRLLEGDPTYVQRFLRLWGTTPPRVFRLRFAYPVRWRHSEFGELAFQVLVNPADAAGSITFNDWIPLNAATIEAVDVMRERTGTMNTFVDRLWTAE